MTTKKDQEGPRRKLPEPVPMSQEEELGESTSLCVGGGRGLGTKILQGFFKPCVLLTHINSFTKCLGRAH